MGNITQKELMKLLKYNKKSGVFTWVKNNRRAKKGMISRYLCRDGYIGIRVSGKRYKAHRLAWLYVEGYWPEHCIDHKNGDKQDNRWKNLRHVTMSCNMQNQKVRNNSKSGITGVCWKRKGCFWTSQIFIKGKAIHLGTYNSKLEAALARFTAESNCPLWSCNCRLELVEKIKAIWPDFNKVSRGNIT